jgi:hypothetical protein
MKAVFNPLIERVATGLLGVDQYPDIFERLALTHVHRAMIRRLGRRRLAADLEAAQFLFIHVPKNGGTSVKRALYRSDPGHASIRYYDLFFPELLRRLQTLAIVRDPVDRFLSGFDFLLNGGGCDVRIQAKPMRRMQHIRTIDALLDHLDAATAGGNWLTVDTFLRPQSWYIVNVEGRIGVTHLWLLDRVGDGLAAFLRDHGVGKLSHANRTSRETRTLTSAQHERLSRLYADDFGLYATVKDAGGYSGSLTGRPVSMLKPALTSASIPA